MKFFAVFIFFWTTFLWSFETLEDSKTRFVFKDKVLDSELAACEDGSYRLLPENGVYKSSSSMPYRAYRIAVPANEKPSVSIRDSIRFRFPEKWCAEDSLQNSAVEVSAPRLHDGLWVVDVYVPLLEISGGDVFVRKNFKVDISFAGKPQNKRPGNRALEFVLNAKGAASFGMGTRAGVLRKAALSETSNMTWLARISIGDRDNGGLSEDGLYAVTYRQVYAACREVSRASDCEGIPIEKIRLYGASPDTLPSVIRASSDILPHHLFEIPLDVRDHSPNSSQADGTFDDGDTLFFVGYGTSLWKRFDLENGFKNDGMEYYYSSSPYSFFQYFQLGFASTGKGMRLSTLASPATGSVIDVLRYVRTERDAALRDNFFGENDESTGKEWFWIWNGKNDSLTVSSSTLFSSKNATLPHFKNGGRNFLSVSYVPHSHTSAAPIRFAMTVNGKNYDGYDKKLPMGNFEIAPELKASGNTYSLKLLPNGSYPDRFDGFSIAYSWTPALENDTSEWVLPGAKNGKIRIPVNSSADMRVMKFLDFAPVGLISLQNGYLLDSVSEKNDTRYLLYHAKNFRKPASIEGIPFHVEGTLSDLSRISSQTEYLIIAPEAFQVPAVNLASFRSGNKSFRSYRTTVVLAEDIYRAYSGGSMDPVAIRNYLSYARSVSPNLTYAVLAGNGHFDYRGFHSGFKTNWIPPFEKEDAAPEDFFAVLDSGEQVLVGSYDLDLFVGRLPLGSVADFNAYNAKIEEHEKIGSADNSVWRNSFVISADDAWTGTAADALDHTTPAEDVARAMQDLATLHGNHLDIHKIYLLNYSADASGQKPAATSDLINRINQGALFTVYFGHGSITDWAFEGLMKPSYVSGLSNESRYTILGSFSCTVGRFEKGNETSLSETFIQASKRGAIASIGATRETYGSLNRVFAKSLLLNALEPKGMTLGKAYAKAKGLTSEANSTQRYNNERYALLGEPVVPMPSSEFSLRLDKKLDTLRALDSVSLSGSVDGMQNGKIHVAVLEQSYEKKLSQAPADRDSVAVLYDGSLIFSEDAEVKDGRFSVQFITPRKMAFGDTAAEIRLWANENASPRIGRLLIPGIAISGTSPYADSIIANDTVPPTIQVQSCLSPSSGTSFSEGEVVTLASPACLQVTVEDSTAINFREDADEGVEFEVSGPVSASPFHPWPFVEQSSKKAVARMNFTESKYPAGSYLFKVSATDIIGNASSRTIRLNITDGLSEGLSDVFTAPNPMKKKGTTFYFKDLAVGRNSDVTIFIYNQNGRLVQRIPHAVSGVTRWDGRDFYGRRLANGLYHYIVVSKVSAESGQKAKTFRKKQKLVISR